ncbi:hypothetical protein FA15DRAFT_724744 [Coprinopsis marcescibilis]|uniref:Alpha-ketoglutarate-dependent dioxygenase AlkB-like domain-containing protein n=1 Tax=Coprinopsis marcescibilis TaxID=230819 RepID=A0A5C3LBK4_COPMA|nr:hypothetical protein FA15DRAFT_724744 [Coprinopsis marcescibilis]
MLPLRSRAHFFLSHLSSNSLHLTPCLAARNLKSCNGLRSYSSHPKISGIPEYLATCFSFWPNFLSLSEQRLLLTAALQRMDSLDSPRAQRKRSKLKPVHSDEIQDIFAPDALYDFAEGHFDGVIHHYREMHLTSWPGLTGLPEIIQRILSLCPSKDVQTHLLHLSSRGDILPHVDNVGASGSWILGVSLGDQRLLRMEAVDDSSRTEPFELLLPSGSVYLQRDHARYKYKHSILRVPGPGGGQQRLSVMLRVRPAFPLHRSVSDQ